MDVVGRFLDDAITEMKQKKSKYTIQRTVPTRDFFKIDESQLYVVRQTAGEDGSYQLVVAAKMRKEVL